VTLYIFVLYDSQSPPPQLIISITRQNSKRSSFRIIRLPNSLVSVSDDVLCRVLAFVVLRVFNLQSTQISFDLFHRVDRDTLNLVDTIDRSSNNLKILSYFWGFLSVTDTKYRSFVRSDVPSVSRTLLTFYASDFFPKDFAAT